MEKRKVKGGRETGREGGRKKKEPDVLIYVINN